jgi:hypothetical protein
VTLRSATQGSNAAAVPALSPRALVLLASLLVCIAGAQRRVCEALASSSTER